MGFLSSNFSSDSFFVCFVTLFVFHVEKNAREWAEAHNKEKPQKVGRFDFLKFALKDIYK